MKEKIDALFNDKSILFNDDDIKLSITSLKIALKSYFSTYHCVKGYFYDVCSYNDNPLDEIFKDDYYKEHLLVEIKQKEYREQYKELIIGS